MTDSKQKVAGKTASRPVSKVSSKPVEPDPVADNDVAFAKRKVMTSSEIEAAAKGAVEPGGSPVPEKVAEKSDAVTSKSGPVAKAPLTSPSSKQTAPANKSSIASPGAARPAGGEKPPVAKSTAPASPTKSEKAETVSTKSKTMTSGKSAASAAPKKTTAAKAAPKKATAAKATPKKAAAAPASTASKSAPAPAPAPVKKVETPAKAAAPAAAKPVAEPDAKPAATQSVAAPKPVEAKLQAEAKQGDVFGFGALFIDGAAMEPYFELWKTPEVEAMVTAGNDAFEDSVSAANEAFGKIFETMTGQADVFSGAGSRVAAQYEELLDTQKKSFEEVWQATMTMFEKTGGIGTELSSWMQKEFEASQEDLDALTKVENLADLQELHSSIVNRCYESSLAEGEKMQELMFSAISDGLNAISKATNVVTK